MGGGGISEKSVARALAIRSMQTDRANEFVKEAADGEKLTLEY